MLQNLINIIFLIFKEKPKKGIEKKQQEMAEKVCQLKGVLGEILYVYIDLYLAAIQALPV